MVSLSIRSASSTKDANCFDVPEMVQFQLIDKALVVYVVVNKINLVVLDGLSELSLNFVEQ